MKIAISSVGKDSSSLLDSRFGRCEYFQIYDDKMNQIKVLENEGFTCNGGAGIKAAQQIIDEKVDIVITGNMGPNAFELIEDANIKLYKGEEEPVEDILNKLSKEELCEIKESKKAHHGLGV